MKATDQKRELCEVLESVDMESFKKQEKGIIAKRRDQGVKSLKILLRGQGIDPVSAENKSQTIANIILESYGLKRVRAGVRLTSTLRKKGSRNRVSRTKTRF